MSEHTDRDPTPAEIEAGRDALRELAPVAPLPADVLARLDARLEREPGLAAPVRRARRRRLRVAFAAPGLAVAMAAVVAIVVISHDGSGAPPQHAAALSQLKQAATPSFRAATTGTSAAADSGAAIPAVPVPALIGRSLADARSLARRSGLRMVSSGSACASDPAPHVARQDPRPGARVAPGSRVRVELATC